MNDPTVLTDNIDRVRIEIGAGRVEIVPADGELTEATLDVRNGTIEDVTFKVVDGELLVELVRPLSRQSPEVRVHIATPATLDARIQSGSGAITARSPLGDARLATGSGDIDLERVEGPLGARTGSGDIRVANALQAVQAGTGSGSIDLGEAGDAVALSTGSGDVRIGDVAGRATIKVGSGDIAVERIRDHSIATSGSGDVQVGLADGPSVQAETARGDVRIGVPDGVPTYLDLRTITGRIRCEMEPGEKPAEGERSLTLRARTVSGDITVYKV